MNTWPSELTFIWEGHGFESAPVATRHKSITGRFRQRKQINDRDDTFNVALYVTNQQLATFKTFVANNPDTFIGPYYDTDVQQIGTLRLVNGAYKLNQQPPEHWLVTFQLEVLNRQHQIGADLYNLATETGADLTSLGDISTALAIAVNENDL